MPSTNWANSSINSTNFKGNASFDDEITRLNSTTVTLDSTTVTLLGYTQGRNFLNTSPSTNYAGGSTNATNFSQSSTTSTNYANGSVNSTDWSTT